MSMAIMTRPFRQWALSRWLKSGAAQLGFGAAAMKHHSVVHLSGNDGRGDLPPDREASGHLGSPVRPEGLVVDHVGG